MLNADTVTIRVHGKDDASNVLKKIGVSLHDMNGNMGKVKAGANLLAGGFDRMVKVGVIGATVAIGGLIGAGWSCVKAFDESQKVTAQLEAVLKSTGNAAGWMKDEAIGLATSLQNVTGMSDETILSGENMLLTFTNIGRDIFPEATETALNMSVALGQDVSNSAMQLGKALNDPIRGITALRRVGVQFNDDQEKTIRTLVESGKTMEAQKLILAELTREFGGSARAAGETFAGKISILKEKFSDFKEEIGKTIKDALEPFVAGLVAWATSDQTKPLIEGINKAIKDVAEYIKSNVIPQIIAVAEKFRDWWQRDETKKMMDNLKIGLENLVNYIVKTAIPKILEITAKFGEWTIMALGSKEGIKLLTAAIIGLVIVLTVGKAISLVISFAGALDLVYKGLAGIIGIIGLPITAILLFATSVYLAYKRAGLFVAILYAIAPPIGGIVESIGRLGDKFKWIKDIINTLRDAIDWMVSSFKTMKRVLSGGVVLPAIPNVPKSPYHLPGEQAGGNISSSGLYYMHKGETVTPSSTSAVMGGARTININLGGVSVHNEADENRLVSKIKEALGRDNELAQSGIY